MTVDMSEAAPGPLRLELNNGPCKVDGCPNPPVATRGRYAYLCAEHRSAAPARKVRRPLSPTGTVTAVLAELRAELAQQQQRTDRLTKAIAALEHLELP